MIFVIVPFCFLSSAASIYIPTAVTFLSLGGESTGFNRPSANARNYICLSCIGWNPGDPPWCNPLHIDAKQWNELKCKQLRWSHLCDRWAFILITLGLRPPHCHQRTSCPFVTSQLCFLIRFQEVLNNRVSVNKADYYQVWKIDMFFLWLLITQCLQNIFKLNFHFLTVCICTE